MNEGNDSKTELVSGNVNFETIEMTWFDKSVLLNLYCCSLHQFSPFSERYLRADVEDIYGSVSKWS